MRWKALRERIVHVDTAMEASGKLLVQLEGSPSDEESSVSQTTHSGTPERSTTSSRTSALERPNSPSGRFTDEDTKRGVVLTLTPVRYSAPRGHSREGRVTSESNKRRRASLVPHKDAQSNDVSCSSQSSLPSSVGSDLGPAIQTPEWNMFSERLLRMDSPAPAIKRSTLSAGRPNLLRATRSASRMSQSSPLVSRIPVPQSEPRGDLYRSPSRLSQSRSDVGSAFLHARSASPTHIPAPKLSRSATASVISDDGEPPTSLMQRTVIRSTIQPSPNSGLLGSQQPKNKHRYFLAVPKSEQEAPPLAQQTSAYIRGNDVTLHPLGAATPTRPPRNTARPNPASSSFHQRPPSSRTTSRPPSRLHDRVATPVSGHNILQTHEYVPGNPKDPLDLEVAAIVNSIAHGFCVERVDPHWRRLPPPTEELKAQYSLTNALGKKVLTCKLLVIQRAAPKTLAGHVQARKVMCRVGGGVWCYLENED